MKMCFFWMLTNEASLDCGGLLSGGRVLDDSLLADLEVGLLLLAILALWPHCWSHVSRRLTTNGPSSKTDGFLLRFSAHLNS